MYPGWSIADSVSPRGGKSVQDDGSMPVAYSLSDSTKLYPGKSLGVTFKLIFVGCLHPFSLGVKGSLLCCQLVDWQRF